MNLADAKSRVGYSSGTYIGGSDTPFPLLPCMWLYSRFDSTSIYIHYVYNPIYVMYFQIIKHCDTLY